MHPTMRCVLDLGVRRCVRTLGVGVRGCGWDMSVSLRKMDSSCASGFLSVLIRLQQSRRQPDIRSFQEPWHVDLKQKTQSSKSNRKYGDCNLWSHDFLSYMSEINISSNQKM